MASPCVTTDRANLSRPLRVGKKLDSLGPRANLVTMGAMERLSWDEICRRYPNEWVVVIDGDWVRDRPFGLVSAIVWSHHQTRRDATPDAKAAIEARGEVGCFFTGKILPDRLIRPW
jgi:hypothetical protein